ncbi:ABC transporter permease [Actinoplanes utahensis]|uniref:Uncharacterized protein n=1 Tax=Actinoplanes utahensis TaxID=1869 RepID=A0A0A6USH9_ACTUT|nr:ABC transporter permease [Actinoplanes utahensis]KHD77943.1 hypothetical protein MB27_07355 [Actinoplanes utahensis]GIF29905.1 hypothetical protein Aut01nite_28910 [Actinoplanes utahensis]
MVTLLHAELRKLLGLRTAWIGLAMGLVAPPALVLLNAGPNRAAIADGSYGDVSDLAFHSLMIAVLGVMTLGVVTVSSEYTPTGEEGGRQITTTLAAMPRRRPLLVAKGAALALVAAVQGAVTTATTLVLVTVKYGDAIPTPEPARAVGAVFYLVLTALLAYAITLIFRNGVVTLTLLIVNSGVVSLSYLLTKVTPVAAYLPDIVGPYMFLRSIGAGDIQIPPVRAGLVMTAWVAALLVLAAWRFDRREA